ncbi:hypothetical protein Tco_1103137 [Tanacetum coccineum]
MRPCIYRLGEKLPDFLHAPPSSDLDHACHSFVKLTNGSSGCDVFDAKLSLGSRIFKPQHSCLLGTHPVHIQMLWQWRQQIPAEKTHHGESTERKLCAKYSEQNGTAVMVELSSCGVM